MPRDTKLDALADMWLFRSLSKKDLQTIGRAAEQVFAPEGKVLCAEGDLGREFYLILDGEAVVKRKGKKVATLTAGQYFGEMALLDKGPRSASVVAGTDLHLLLLGQREFAGLLDKVPGLGQKLLAIMAARLREADTRLYG